MIDRYASLIHYAAHITPVWDALPADVRGRSMAPRSCGWGTPSQRGIPLGTGPVLVASYADARKMAPRPVVYVEHGTGQTYGGDPTSARHGSYAGGVGLGHAVLFLAPNGHVAARWRDAYPGTPVAVVGCPRLDQWHRGETPRTRGNPVVAFTWHWDCPLVPETRSALRHYLPALPTVIGELRGEGVDVIGHGHPRAWRHLRGVWGRLGVEPVERFEDVVARASVLVADNSSTMFEWAAIDRPVVALNAPWYRRNVEHGLRFWSHVPGVEVDDADCLTEAVLGELDWPSGSRHLRAAAADRAYAHRDGHAARRAADAIMEVLCRTPSPPVDPSGSATSRRPSSTGSSPA